MLFLRKYNQIKTNKDHFCEESDYVVMYSTDINDYFALEQLVFMLTNSLFNRATLCLFSG